MKVVTLLFWNTRSNSVELRIRRLVERNDVDLVIIAESTIGPLAVLRALNDLPGAAFHMAPGNSPKLILYTRFDPTFLRPVFEGQRFTIRELALPALQSVLIAAVHLPSKANVSSEGHMHYAEVLADAIRTAEQLAGHDRTVIIGDLNMNPFDAGAVTARGLHAVMSRRVAARKARVIQGTSYPFLYNPMWNFFGDDTPCPPGTYYRQSADPVNHFWHMYDQILVRPSLMSRLDTSKIRIVDDDGSEPLVTPSGIPDGVNASDHLPIICSLQLPLE